MLCHTGVYGSEITIIWFHQLCAFGLELQNNQSGPEDTERKIPTFDREWGINFTSIYHSKLQGRYRTYCIDT